jgi:hypothetical protein
MRLFENDEDLKQDAILFDRDVVVKVKPPLTIEEVDTALKNKEYYGRYIQNIRSSKVTEKDLEDHFGPRSPRLRAKMERERGEPFPIRTPDNIKAFILSRESKVNILHWYTEGDLVIFPKDRNTLRDKTESIVKTVLTNAGIDSKLYKIERKAITEFLDKGEVFKRLLKEESDRL